MPGKINWSFFAPCLFKTLSRRYCGLLLLTQVFTFALNGQTGNDTLNKYNPNKKKDGYWTFYFDAQHYRCLKKGARYYGYIYYNNGSAKMEPVGRDGKKDRIEYIPYSNDDEAPVPEKLNGELYNYSSVSGRERLHYYESYRNGKLSVVKEYYYQEKDTAAEVDICFLDSLYNNIPQSYLFYKMDRNILLYKQYMGLKKDKPAISYFVKHEDFKSRYRPLIGFSGTLEKPADKINLTRDFIEVGLTKRYVKGVYIDTTKKTYHGSFGTWHAFNVSLLSSLGKGKTCLGQKLTYSYSFAVLRAEVGFINYTDFVKDDLRFTMGFGLSAFGFLNETLSFSLPLGNSSFTDIGRVSLSIFIN